MDKEQINKYCSRKCQEGKLSTGKKMESNRPFIGRVFRKSFLRWYSTRRKTFECAGEVHFRETERQVQRSWGENMLKLFKEHQEDPSGWSQVKRKRSGKLSQRGCRLRCPIWQALATHGYLRLNSFKWDQLYNSVSSCGSHSSSAQ